jgi:hypothetical protein
MELNIEKYKKLGNITKAKSSQAKLKKKYIDDKITEINIPEEPEVFQGKMDALEKINPELPTLDSTLKNSLQCSFPGTGGDFGDDINELRPDLLMQVIDEVIRYTNETMGAIMDSPLGQLVSTIVDLDDMIANELMEDLETLRNMKICMTQQGIDFSGISDPYDEIVSDLNLTEDGKFNIDNTEIPVDVKDQVNTLKTKTLETKDKIKAVKPPELPEYKEYYNKLVPENIKESMKWH